MSKDRMKPRHVDSMEGWVGYERMRYACGKCGRGNYPVDQELRIGKESRMSQKKERQLARLSARMPYEEAKQVYEELTHQRAGRMTAHRIAQRLGTKLKSADTAEPKKSWDRTSGKRHVTADGTMVHLREEGWKELKVGACYEAVGKDRRAEGIVYTATLGERAQLGARIYRLAGELEMEETRKMAFVSDGAEWLAEIQQYHFPLATAIIDFYHASEYVWKAAHGFYGEGTLKARQWAEGKMKQLKKADQNGLQRSFGRLKAKTEAQREVLKTVRRYFHNHGHKMDYPRYRKKGFHIGSGVAEGACKYVIQARFKRAGMRWSREGAENLLQLRLAHLNDCWDSVAACQLN